MLAKPSSYQHSILLCSCFREVARQFSSAFHLSSAAQYNTLLAQLVNARHFNVWISGFESPARYQINLWTSNSDGLEYETFNFGVGRSNRLWSTKICTQLHGVSQQIWV